MTVRMAIKNNKKKTYAGEEVEIRELLYMVSGNEYWYLRQRKQNGCSLKMFKLQQIEIELEMSNPTSEYWSKK